MSEKNGISCRMFSKNEYKLETASSGLFPCEASQVNMCAQGPGFFKAVAAVHHLGLDG